MGGSYTGWESEYFVGRVGGILGEHPFFPQEKWRLGSFLNVKAKKVPSLRGVHDETAIAVKLPVVRLSENVP